MLDLKGREFIQLPSKKFNERVPAFEFSLPISLPQPISTKPPYFSLLRLMKKDG